VKPSQSRARFLCRLASIDKTLQDQLLFHDREFRLGEVKLAPSSF
jgi:hypothetical protein